MNKLKMKKFGKALFDIGTAMEVDNICDDAWYLSLVVHVALGNKKEAEQDIRHISCHFMQEEAFDVICGFVDKLERFDMEWFKILIGSCSYKAMQKLDNVVQWKSLCDNQYGANDYTKWYDTAVTCYINYNNATRSYVYTKAFFEKVYYMHKSMVCT